jgi:hypothetical protein
MIRLTGNQDRDSHVGRRDKALAKKGTWST